MACFLIVLAVQQDLRIGANDLPQQLAEDAARALDAGAQPAAVIPDGMIPIDLSLAPFVAVYGADGRVVVSNGTLAGGPPMPPRGVLDYAIAHGRDAITWQPRDGVRQAIVVLPWRGGTVVAGQSLRVIETRIEAIEALVLVGLVAGLIALAVIAGLAAYLWPSGPEPG